ncbi:MAG: OsmC family protein [Halofilum sp. (in: g-proteobacteria)]|nr:OsmC family protein [Halofilum sp. (in: g-proteobacteria)]
MKTRNAAAAWQGDLKGGKGTLTSDSKVLSATPYAFHDRFEEGGGTNPEELIGAAHAGCYSMALSMILGEAGLTPERVDTSAAVTLDEVEGGFRDHQDPPGGEGEGPGASQEQFDECANAAKAGCPVSKLLNAEVTMDATLAS